MGNAMYAVRRSKGGSQQCKYMKGQAVQGFTRQRNLVERVAAEGSSPNQRLTGCQRLTQWRWVNLWRLGLVGAFEVGVLINNSVPLMEQTRLFRYEGRRDGRARDQVSALKKKTQVMSMTMTGAYKMESAWSEQTGFVSLGLWGSSELLWLVLYRSSRRHRTQTPAKDLVWSSIDRRLLEQLMNATNHSSLSVFTAQHSLCLMQ